MLARGLWAALANVATRTVPPEVAMIVSYLTGVAVAGAHVFVADKPVEVAGTGSASPWRPGCPRVWVPSRSTPGETLPLRDAAGVGFAVLAVALLTL